MAVNYLNEIISVFLQRNVNELSNNDISIAIRTNGKDCSVEEIRRVVQSSGSSLFQLRYREEDTCFIQVHPKINICRDFLAGKCSHKSGRCNQLHLCRRFGQCAQQDCHFPHNLNSGNNRRVRLQWKCQNVDSVLLVDLLRLSNHFSHPSSKTKVAHPIVEKTTDITSTTAEQNACTHLRRLSHGLISTGIADRNILIQPTPVQPTSNANCQIDLRFLLTTITRYMTIERIEDLLKMQGLLVEKRLYSRTNKNVRQWTLQFEQSEALDDLLKTSVIPYKDFSLKFKRTHPRIDSHSFILESTIDSIHDSISLENFCTYIDILINRCFYNVTDLSSPWKQILLIQCDKTIDFRQLHCAQQSNRQLQGRDILLKQIYETDMAIIESTQTPLSFDIVQDIIKLVHQNVFTFTIESHQTALVEFIHTDALKQWLLISDKTKQKFNVDIKPDIICVDEVVNSDTSCLSYTSQLKQSEADDTASQMTITLRRGWIMIVNHPTFSLEYKNYIRSELGFEIDIHGDRVQICANLTADTSSEEHPSSLLNSRTDNFMKAFTVQSMMLREPMKQLDILHAHSSIVAFCRTTANNYLLATRKSNKQYIMQKLLSQISPQKKPENHQPVATSVDQKDTPTFIIPAPLRNLVPTDNKATINNEIITKSVPLPNNTPAQIALFTDKTFENNLQIYFTKTFNVKLSIEVMSANNELSVVKIVGHQSAVDGALKELFTLISLCRTMTFRETTDDIWAKISDAVHVIRHQLHLRSSLCVCQQQTSPISILVHYIDEKHNKLGISEQSISFVCRKQLIAVTCTSNILENEWTTFKRTILRCANYGKDICLSDEQQTITFYGLTNVVKDVQQQFETMNKKDKKINVVSPPQRNDPVVGFPSKINPIASEPDKIQPILDLRVYDIGPDRRTEPNHKDCEDFSKESSRKFPTPAESDRNSCTQAITNPQDLKVENPSKSTIHHENSSTTPKLVQTRSVMFYVDEPGFEVLVNRNINQLLAIVQSKCLLEKEIIHHQIQIQIPKANVYKCDQDTSEGESQENRPEPSKTSGNASNDLKTNWFLKLFQGNKPKTTSPTPAQPQTPIVQVSSTSNIITSVTIDNSKITVCTGDLTKQVVDIIVVCSTSTLLCDAIISAAGSQVKQMYNQQISCGIKAFETIGGTLPCKHIIFRPCILDKSHFQDLKQSIDTFVTSVITYAVRHKLTKIAFPSIGCGQLGFDPKIIADHMIGETYRQLKIPSQSQLLISFVLLPEQKNVCDAFADRLNRIQLGYDTLISIPFDKQTVKITMTGSNGIQLIECQNEIKKLARLCSFKLHLTDQIDMADWLQNTIQKYYEYCLQRRVMPTLDIQNSVLDLTGPKDAVFEAEKYFFQLTAETLRNARVRTISRGFVWSVEVSSGKLEQYSCRINEQIEQAQQKNLPHVDFKNEKSEQCRVIFTSMVEQCQNQKRRVCRKRIDSSLPHTWDLSGGNFKRMVILNSSMEYADVLNRFEITMKGHYRKIEKIERIQNERWYKQYAAHRDEFQQRYKQPDERLLFHGCSSMSADKIVQECFNRAFAGVNGVVYGCGVYFHEHAKYSDSYTKQNASAERTMFLARVLVGKTCLGNSSMKVPPEGHDTTTDGQHIFVVYHDAGAYGEYLITYS